MTLQIDEVGPSRVLQGTEVKSLRQGQASLSESWAGARESELWLNNCFIPEYNNSASFANHEARRPRKLLLHRREMQRLIEFIRVSLVSN